MFYTGNSFTIFTQSETKWGRGVRDHLNQPMVSPSLCGKRSKGRGEFESTRTRRRPFTFVHTSVFTFFILSPRVTNSNFLLIISIHNQENWLWELIKQSAEKKNAFIFLFFLLVVLEMYRDQFGEFVCGYWGLKD